MNTPRAGISTRTAAILTLAILGLAAVPTDGAGKPSPRLYSIDVQGEDRGFWVAAANTGVRGRIRKAADQMTINDPEPWVDISALPGGVCETTVSVCFRKLQDDTTVLITRMDASQTTEEVEEVVVQIDWSGPRKQFHRFMIQAEPGVLVDDGEGGKKWVPGWAWDPWNLELNGSASLKLYKWWLQPISGSADCFLCYDEEKEEDLFDGDFDHYGDTILTVTRVE